MTFKITDTMFLQELLTVMKIARLGLWSWNIEEQRGTILNTTMTDLLGLSLTQEFSREDFLRAVYPDDREYVQHSFSATIEQKNDWACEFRMQTPDQPIYWVSVQTHLFNDEQGQPTNLIGIAFDITRRHLIEERLQTANEEQKILLDSITDGFFRFDSDLKCTYVNKQAERIFKLQKQNALGKSPRDFLASPEKHPLKSIEVLDHWIHWVTISQQSAHFESFFESIACWLDVYLYPIKNGIAMYVHDITKRKIAENMHQNLEERFHLLFRSNIVGMIVASIHGDIIEANNAFLTMLGYTQQDLTKGEINWVEMTPVEYLHQDFQAIQQLKNEGMFLPIEKVYIGKNHKEVPILAAGVAMDNNCERVLCYILDMSNQKELEKQRTLMMSIVGHELRTPLTAIQGNLQLMQKRLQKFLQKDHERAPETTSLLIDVSTRANQSIRELRVENRLINDLLDSARLSINQLDLALQPCDLVTIVRETIEDLQAFQQDHTIELRLEKDEIKVQADPDRVSQVLSNYLTNAFKYTPPDKPIIVDVSLREIYAYIAVRDQGPGLSQEEQNQIWNPFTRKDKGEARHGPWVNMGIGLHVCRHLIERHGGETGVESSPVPGATFWFTLPHSHKPLLS